MSLTTKAFVLAVAVCISYIIMPHTQLMHSTYAYIGFSILIALIIFGFIYQLIIKRITKLNQFIENSLNFNKSGRDEITVLSDHISNILDQLQKSRTDMQQHLLHCNGALKKANDQLNHEKSERKRAEKSLTNSNDGFERLAHYDQLTGLPTRIFFNESLNKAIIHAKRHNNIQAVLVVNVDSFKNINAAIGHDAGDLVIKELALRLKTTLRAEDILAKHDGDEFIILLSDVGKAKFASTVANKILRACSEPFNINNNELSLTVSIGIVVYPDDGDSLETLLTNVNTALEAVKHAGGNGYQFYTKAMDIEGHEYIQLETALRNAIQNNQLSLHYQPLLHIKRGRIISVEALMRWDHPEFGIINPGVFIPLAEETNLIIPIGEWALTEACKANKRWQDEGYEHLTMSFNLSAKQFYHPDICNVISRILKETGINPEFLELEITETTVMHDIKKSTDILNNIKACGVQISIDHFGVGYTSISHLKQFPISIIKIDQSFIKGIPNNPNDLSIVNAFIALAKNLGLNVVAEGVETAEQVEYLSNHQCDIVQGYYFCHPLSEEKIILQFKKILDDVLVL